MLEASPERPYLGVGLRIDAAAVRELLLETAGPTAADQDKGAAPFFFGRAPDAVLSPLGRMLHLLDAPDDIPVLAPLATRELLFRLLSSPARGALLAGAAGHARLAQVAEAADWIRRHADRPMRIEDLATRVGMSVTSFHRHFRAVTSHSPLAYQRHVRLLAARDRLLGGGSVAETAFASGYASASQFSREYRRLFGHPPVTDLKGDGAQAA